MKRMPVVLLPVFPIVAAGIPVAPKAAGSEVGKRDLSRCIGLRRLPASEERGKIIPTQRDRPAELVLEFSQNR